MKSLVYKINYKLTLFILGFLALVNGVFMLLSAGVSWAYKDGTLIHILTAGGLAALLGSLLMLFTRNYKREISTRESFLMVALSWIFMAFVGTLPYLISGTIPHFT